MSTTSSFRELRVWQAAMELVRAVYRATTEFPSDERFGITSQIRRACVSVPSNIAEGSGRRHSKEFAHFLAIAEGSLRESETLWILSQDLGLASPSPAIDELLDKTGRMLNRLQAAAKDRPNTNAKQRTPKDAR